MPATVAPVVVRAGIAGLSRPGRRPTPAPYEEGVDVLVITPPSSPVSSVSLGVAVGLSLSLSVGVEVGVGEPLVGGGVLGAADEAPTVGAADVAGAPLDMVGVGVTDGVGVAQDGVGDGDGEADDVRLSTSSSAFSVLAEVVEVVEVALSAAVVTAGTAEAATPLVRSVVTVAVQVADAVGCGEAAPPDEGAPEPLVGPSAPVGVAFAPAEPPLPVGEPSPSVPAPPCPEEPPPLSTVLLA
jgi:hypothetical protein